MILIWSCDMNVNFEHLHKPQNDLLGATKGVILKLRKG